MKTYVKVEGSCKEYTVIVIHSEFLGWITPQHGVITMFTIFAILSLQIRKIHLKKSN